MMAGSAISRFAQHAGLLEHKQVYEDCTIVAKVVQSFNIIALLATYRKLILTVFSQVEAASPFLASLAVDSRAFVSKLPFPT